MITLNLGFAHQRDPVFVRAASEAVIELRPTSANSSTSDARARGRT